MQLVDLAITNSSADESFDLLGIVLPIAATVELEDVPFSRANALVIAASGVSAINVSVKGMESTAQGLITNELAMLRTDNVELKQQVQTLSDNNELNAATIIEQGVLISALTSEKAELKRLLDEALASAPTVLPASASESAPEGRAAKTKGVTK